VLTPGSVVGSYSLINENPFAFSARAKTNLSLLVLKWSDIMDLAEEIKDLSDSIESATEYIFDYEVPECDYTLVKAPSSSKNILSTTFIGAEIDNNPFKTRWSNAIRRVIVLNKNKEKKKIKLLELINFTK
jgi:hypothetical protein